MTRAAISKYSDICSHPIRFYHGSIFAGMAISLGAMISNVINISYGKLPAAIFFSIGLLIICFLGGQLFTGNVMVLSYGFLKCEIIKFHKVVVGMLLCYCGNYIGCLIFSSMFVGCDVHGMDKLYSSMMASKLSMNLLTVFMRAVLCNVFVCLGVAFYIMSEEVVVKIVGIVSCISSFIILGFEHSIANMANFVAAYYYDSSLSIRMMLMHLAVVTAGNIVGGMVIAIFLKIKESE